MCSIAGALSLSSNPVEHLERKLEVMNEILAHRGPDGQGIWTHDTKRVGFAHRRLSIMDLSDAASQPMQAPNGDWICYNGEVYNYIELRNELGADSFHTTGDTEVVLRAYEKWGEDCVNHFNGMFAFAIWDEKKGRLFCARDRYGIKPFYYTVVDKVLYFASEAKALLPLLPDIKTDPDGLNDYLTFQFCLNGKTLFEGIRELRPACRIIAKDGHFSEERYWEVYYRVDLEHTERYFMNHLEELLYDSVKYHVRSDVPLGGYISGGVDSSIVASIAKDNAQGEFVGFTGKFTIGEEYDESRYAQLLADNREFSLYQMDITADDFINNISNVIYHLDYPVAGPGAFSQYMISSLAAKHRKVVLGGQGGDEIFGGYTRYLVAYFEQCIKGAIDGTMDSGNFVVTYKSIIPNLVSLKNYKPMLKQFWSHGLFDDADKRYFELINRAPQMGDCVRWENLKEYSPYETFRGIFLGDNVNKKSYFDQMTHFDFKTLLPALLQVEDRMSMAHGLESRVPFLDQNVVEFSATIPADIKFKDGNMKYLLRKSMSSYVPSQIMDRKDKMGFPTPFNRWAQNEANELVMDTLSSARARSRDFVDNAKVLEKLSGESKFSRNIWGLFCLELWQQTFHDNARKYREMI